jgi:hypothetical protein
MNGVFTLKFANAIGSTEIQLFNTSPQKHLNKVVTKKTPLLNVIFMWKF